MSSPLKVDVAVIGSGPGGSITACLLAEAGKDVLLIEEGLDYTPDSCEPFSIDEMLQKYRNGGLTVALGIPKVSYVEGKCVGGGSEVNSGLYHRTPPAVLDQWRRDYNVQGLEEKELLPHFESCEKEVSVGTVPGKLPVASMKLQEGADKLNLRAAEIPRVYKYNGHQQTGVPQGVKQSMSRTFIPRALKAGAKLKSQTRVLKLTQSSVGWQLTCFGTKGPLIVDASDVFVCCGAVQTPALLRRSGITANVGNSLHLHPTVKVTARFNENVNGIGMGVPMHQVRMPEWQFNFGGSISSPPYLGLALLDHKRSKINVSSDWNRMAVYYAAVNGSGVGTVRGVPGFDDPLVRYRVTETDRANLSKGLRLLCELLLEAGAVDLYPSIPKTTPINDRAGISQLQERLFKADANLMTIHLMSSCPMGEDASKSAVNSFGRVHGFKNLFVSDASVFCSGLGVNPQGTVMALARRNALNYLGRL